MKILTKVGWISVLVQGYSIQNTSADIWVFEMDLSFAKEEGVRLAAEALPNWVVQFEDRHGSEKMFMDKVSQMGSREEKVARVLMDTPEGIFIRIRSMSEKSGDSYMEVGPSNLVVGVPRYFMGRQLEKSVRIEGVLS